ncbi:agamous-like mads-box protein agl80-like, partial [Trifolium pratense]
GLIKKIDEITTLCGVQGCAIIFGQNDPQPAIWPSPSGVHTVLTRFRSLPELEQSKKMQNQERFLRERIQKGEEQLNKLRNENRKKELTQLMLQCLNVGQIIGNVNMNDLNGLYWLIEQNMKQIERRMEETQAVAVVENHGENVIESAQGMENNVGAMQTQHFSLDFMTNNNVGDVLPFENGNNVPNGFCV